MRYIQKAQKLLDDGFVQRDGVFARPSSTRPGCSVIVSLNVSGGVWFYQDAYGRQQSDQHKINWSKTHA